MFIPNVVNSKSVAALLRQTPTEPWLKMSLVSVRHQCLQTGYLFPMVNGLSIEEAYNDLVKSSITLSDPVVVSNPK